MKVLLQRQFPNPEGGYDAELLKVLKQWQFDHARAINAASTYSYQTPADAFSITVPDVDSLILDPAGILNTGTLTLPASADGHILRITSEQPIHAITINPNTGQTVKNAPTSLFGGGIGIAFQLANSVWYRLY